MSEPEAAGPALPRADRFRVGELVAMVGCALAFLVQFGGSIWWGATISADVRYINVTLQQDRAERYTKAEASRDMQRLEQRDQQFADQIGEIRNRIQRIEDGATGRQR